MFLDLLQELGLKNALQLSKNWRSQEDIQIGFADRMIAKVELFEKRIEEYEMMLDESTIWLVRLQGVGYASRRDGVPEFQVQMLEQLE